MNSEKEYSNWKEVALCLVTASALIFVEQYIFAGICVLFAVGYTIDESIQKKKGDVDDATQEKN